MKTKFTLLVTCVFVISAMVYAGTNPSSSGNKSAGTHQAINKTPLRNLPASIGVPSVTQCGTAFPYTDSLHIPDFVSTPPVVVSASINVTGISGTNLGSDVFLSKVHIAGHHSWLGDIIISLTAPNAAVARLMDRPGRTISGFGCGNANFSFDVIPGTGHDNETTCFTTPTPPVPPGVYAISGVFTVMSGDDLNNLNTAGGDPNGTWTMSASDNSGGDVGAIDTLILYFVNANSVFSYSISSTTVDFTAPTNPGAAFGWDFGDGNFGSGQTVSNTYAVAGSYLVTMTIATPNECIVSQQVNPAVGVGMPSLGSHDKKISLAPNPSSGMVDISISEISSANATLTIRDSFGRILKTLALRSGTFHQTLDISEWSKGVYFVNVVDKDFIKVQKLVLN